MGKGAIDSFHLTSGLASLYCERSGNGPCAVMLHAGVADSRMWRETVLGLSANFLALTYDRRGFGRTSSPDESFHQTGDLAAVIASVGSGRTHLIGCSQGGRIAIDYALAHPQNVASLTLVATALSGAKPPDSYDPRIQLLLNELDQAEADQNIDRINEIEAHLWLDGPLSNPGRAGISLRGLFLDMNGLALRNSPLNGEMPPPPATERLEEIKVPTLVVWGDRDFPHVQRRSQWIAGCISGAESKIMKDCAHLPNLERPQEFNATVSAFLARHR